MPKGVAIRVSEALDGYSEGDVATAVETSKDTAQSWKLERRAPNSAFLLALGHGLDEVGMMIAEEIDAGRFYNRESIALKILTDHAMDESPEGRFARDMLREIAIRNLT